MRFPAFIGAALVAVVAFSIRTEGQSPDDYLNFVRVQAAELRRNDRPPETAADWHERKASLREHLTRSWGDFPERKGAVEVRMLGELKRDEYRIEKLILQTFPGVWMTANAYIPAKPGKLPALLMVHGHWRGAKQDPVVQARCIGAAKLGFFVLVVDAFGAGERGIGRSLGEYHGDMTAATLFPTGLTLSGLQVFENMRAVDYLHQRPEVDSARIGVTGASGGGNQSMYLAAWDERIAAAVPVCSVGNYQAYLGAACCQCEVVPGALKYTEEWGVLGMIAPRALMVINATRDSRQFSVTEANRSIAQATEIFKTLGQQQKLRHVTFESGHDYSRPMREAVYGWMTLHLKNEGDGAPITEPEFKPEDPETLRCYPGESRPDDWMTLPRFAAREAKRILAAKKEVYSRDSWPKQREILTNSLVKELFGGFPEAKSLNVKITSAADGAGREISYNPEPGITLKARQQSFKKERILLVLDLEGASHAAESEATRAALAAEWSVITLDLRATGELAWPGDKIGRAPDHTTAQWGLWIGRPLLGQWVWDVRRLLDAIHETDSRLPAEIGVVGIGPAGMVALAVGAIDARVTRVLTVGTLASFITEIPYEGQRMGIMVPGILKSVGDVGELAALVAPKPLLVIGGLQSNGLALGLEGLKESFAGTQKIYSTLSAENKLRLTSGSDAAVLREFLLPPGN